MATKRNDRRITGNLKASESIVASQLCGIFGIPAYDELHTALEAIGDRCADAFPLFGEGQLYLFPWVASVANEIMADRMNAVQEHLMMHEQSIFIIKDRELGAKEGLWLAGADVDLFNRIRPLPFRGIVNHIHAGEGEILTLEAVQITSCLRKI